MAPPASGPAPRQFAPEALLLQQAKQAATRQMIWGLVWLAGGVFVSIASYYEADPGEMYGILWGAAAFGFYKFIRGLYYQANPTKFLEEITRG
jgi:hypothetical protein